MPSSWSLYSWFAFNGKYLLMKPSRKTIYIVDTKGTPILKFTPAEEGSFGPYLAANGREMWLFSFRPLKCFRYRIP